MSSEMEQELADNPKVVAYRVGELEKGLDKFRVETAEQHEKLTEKIQEATVAAQAALGTFTNWLRGTMGTLILALILLALNLVLKTGAPASTPGH